MKIKKILITGFQPFANDPTNPSGDWITWMKARKTPEHLSLETAILPVTFNGGFASFKKVYDDFCPDLVVMTGLAQNRVELSVERIGINWIDARIPDNDGDQPLKKKINEEGPDGLFTTIDIEKMIELSKSVEVPLKISTSAGEYVCNDLLYKVLYYVKNKNTKATFIHIPGRENYDGIYLALEAIVNGL